MNALVGCHLMIVARWYDFAFNLVVQICFESRECARLRFMLVTVQGILRYILKRYGKRILLNELALVEKENGLLNNFVRIYRVRQETPHFDKNLKNFVSLT